MVVNVVTGWRGKVCVGRRSSIGSHMLLSQVIVLHCGGRVPVSWLLSRYLE